MMDRLLILDISPMMPALLSGSRARSHLRFPFVTRHKTAPVFGQGHRSRTHLNLLRSFFHSPTFYVFPVFRSFPRVFDFARVF